MGSPIRSICSQITTSSAKENPTDCKPLQLEFQAQGGRRWRPAQHRRRCAAVAPGRRAARPDAAPDNRTFLEKLRPDERRSTSFMPANISTRFPTVASNWYEKYHVVLRDDVDGKVALSPRQGDDGTGGSQARTPVFRKRMRRMRYASLKASSSGVVRQQGAGQPHETGRHALEH